MHVASSVETGGTRINRFVTHVCIANKIILSSCQYHPDIELNADYSAGHRYAIQAFP